MRSWPGASLAWLGGCVLWLVGCSSPTADAVPTQADPPPPNPLAVHTVHHAPQQVRPVLTWRDNPSPRVPMTLTASDGAGLDLVSVKARVVIEDPLAFTELHLTFDNPEARRREGRFEIELPPGAVLSRLSMRIGNRWQEGEVVERGKAQRTYETFLHERPDVDPALLEHDTANRVGARVFPIEPLQRKEIVVSFSQELGAAPYRLPLQGLSTIEDFDVQVVAHTHEAAQSGVGTARRVVDFQRTHFTPDKDLVVELDGATEAAGLHAGRLAVVRVRPQADRPAERPESMLVLFDTSASAHRGFEERVEHFGQLVQALAQAGDFRLRVDSFDQEVRTLYEGQASELHVDVLADLVEGRALGASNLEAALTHAAASHERWQRVLLVSDGSPTAGRTERAELRGLARGLEAVGVRRLDVLAPGTRFDRGRLGDLASALPEAGSVIDDRRDTPTLARSLSEAPFGDVAITVEGASWSWPDSLQGVQPGDDVLVFAHFDGPRPEAIGVSFSDPSIPSHQIETLQVDAPLVERAWAGARIARIEHELARLAPTADQARRDLDARIVELSTHYRVLNGRTALLVLETEADYRRFRIDRQARADILHVVDGSIAVHRRSEGSRPDPLLSEDLRATVADEASPDGPEAPPEEVVAPPTIAAASDDSGILGVMQAESGHFLASPYGGAFGQGNDDADVWGGLTGTEVGEAFGVGGLGASGVGGAGGFVETFGPGDGFDTGGSFAGKGDHDVWGNLAGTEIGEGFGEGGLGLVGTGRGGGGTGEGTIGLGNTGLIGRGSSGGSGSGYGRGAGSGFGGRGARVPQVRMAQPMVQGMLDKTIVRRIVRAHVNEVRYCYNQGLVRRPDLQGKVQISFVVTDRGDVTLSVVESSTLRDSDVANCIARAVRRWKFPKNNAEGTNRVSMPFELSPADGVSSAAWGRGMSHWGHMPVRRRVERPAHVGRFAEVQRLLAAGQTDAAYDQAWSWVQSQPDDMLAFIALGEALEQRGRPRLAARVYGSLIDLHPSRPDVRRAAGERLERLDDEGALALAIDSYGKADAARPDHPSGARLHAWALVRRGDLEGAFAVLREASERRYPAGRFAGIHTLLKQDLAIVASAWLHSAQGDERARVLAQLDQARVTPDEGASTRFVITWETDTTDVDVLPRVQGRGSLQGHRIADVRTGFGPEARVLRGDRVPSRLQASVRYFDRGAMGHAMGTLQVITHDGQGRVHIDARPFVLMQQKGVLDLGSFETVAGMSTVSS